MRINPVFLVVAGVAGLIIVTGLVSEGVDAASVKQTPAKYTNEFTFDKVHQVIMTGDCPIWKIAADGRYTYLVGESTSCTVKISR